mmetsp:Transcript_9879/g.29928  ORF Transcript_9879/g.29928 Transcript_9879/m.29928 type:complete len:185 (+) Transcript_9879:1224-1778(+)
MEETLLPFASHVSNVMKTGQYPMSDVVLWRQFEFCSGMTLCSKYEALRLLCGLPMPGARGPTAKGFSRFSLVGDTRKKRRPALLRGFRLFRREAPIEESTTTSVDLVDDEEVEEAEEAEEGDDDELAEEKREDPDAQERWTYGDDLHWKFDASKLRGASDAWETRNWLTTNAKKIKFKEIQFVV